MNVLLDIGNTRLKWATDNQGDIQDSHACDYRQPGYLAGLEQVWREIDAPRNLAIASVSEKRVLNSLAQLGQTLWPHSRLLIPQASAAAFGVINAYQQPERLGIDRWLAMIAAHNLYPGNVCVVDCGTAVTLDAVRADGQHLGGLICPGLNVMKQALVSNTADLMFTRRSYDTELGSATEAAIANGVCAAVIGLIEHTLSKLDADYRLVLTGGDAAYLVDLLRVSVSYDRDLVLKGLSIFCRGDANL